MRTWITSLLFVIFLTGIQLSVFSQVQDGYLDNLAVLYEEGEFQDCAFKAERMLLKEKYKNDPEVYLYLAISYNKIYLMTKEDESLLQENAEYAKAYENALKYGLDAKKKDKKAGEFFPQNDNLLKEIVYTGLPIADQFILQKKYSKASTLYRKFLRLTDNQHINFIKGVMDLYSLDKVSANESFSVVFAAMRGDRLDKDENTFYLMKTGFVMYYDFLMQEDSVFLADSARGVVQMGLKYFPNDYELGKRLQPRKSGLE